MNCPKCGSKISECSCSICGFNLKTSDFYYFGSAVDQGIMTLDQYIQDEDRKIKRVAEEAEQRQGKMEETARRKRELEETARKQDALKNRGNLHYDVEELQDPIKKIGLANEERKRKADAQFDLGVKFLDELNYQKALEYFSEAAEQGHVKSQYYLGDMYANGRGIEKDDKKAFEWYKKAAEQGHAFASLNLANMYRGGRGIERDDKKSFEWYKKAAEQGCQIASSHIALVYKVGLGGIVERDDEKAKEWDRKAAEQGRKVLDDDNFGEDWF